MTQISEEILSVITSHVYSAFTYCLRQGWFAAHRIHGRQTNDYLARGRLVEDFYSKRGHRQVYILGSVVDIVDAIGDDIRIIEVKASKGSLDRGIAQAEYLLYIFYMVGITNIVSEVTVPKSRQVIKLEFTSDVKKRVEKNILHFYNIALNETPPEVEISSRCKACAYRDLCEV